MEYSLYNGEVSLLFDESKHEYKVDGKVIPGVTSALEMIGKPWLAGWAIKMGAEYLEKVWLAGDAYDELEIAGHIAAMKRAHRQHKQRAADIGTLAHSYCERIIKALISGNSFPDMPVNVEARAAVNAFHEWINDHTVEFLGSEEKIYSRQHRFAGTLDFDAVIDGQRAIGDLKTSKAIYNEMWAQTAAYQLAREEEGHGPYAARWIIRIGKDGVLEPEYRPFGYEADRDAFLAALTLYRWVKNGKP